MKDEIAENAASDIAAMDDVIAFTDQQTKEFENKILPIIAEACRKAEVRAFQKSVNIVAHFNKGSTTKPMVLTIQEIHGEIHKLLTPKETKD